MAGITTVRSLIKEGDVAKTVLDIAQKEQVDLIIVGRRGHGRVATFFLGSVAHKIIQYADRSVLMVD